MSSLLTQDGISRTVDSRREPNRATRPESQPDVPDLVISDLEESTESAWPVGQPILYVGALISLVAATIHLLVIPEHFHEWWGYGVFFLVSALWQSAFAVMLIGTPSRALHIAGLVGNLAIVVVWAVTRTRGVPYFGPNVGEIEEIGVHDVIATTAEVVLVLLLVCACRAGKNSQPTIPADV